MIKRKRLLPTVRFVLSSVGLSFICVGTFIKSIQCEDLQALRDISTFFFLILGFMLLIIGVLWSVDHGMKSVLMKSSEWRLRNTDVHVFTVDRSNFYPPPYTESQIRSDTIEGAIHIPTDMPLPGIAPPVYSERSSETFSENFSLEEPPNYQQAVLERQPNAQATNFKFSY